MADPEDLTITARWEWSVHDRPPSIHVVSPEATDAGTTRYSTPDWNRGRPTGFLEVDRLLNSLPIFRPAGIA